MPQWSLIDDDFLSDRSEASLSPKEEAISSTYGSSSTAELQQSPALDAGDSPGPLLAELSNNHISIVRSGSTTKCPNCGRSFQTDSVAPQTTRAEPGSTRKGKRLGRPFGAKERRPGTRPPKTSHRQGQIFVPERPSTITESRRNIVNAAQEQQLYHWHQIQNTAEGKDAFQSCKRCRHQGLECRVYRFKAKVNVCGECKMIGMKCEDGLSILDDRGAGGRSGEDAE